MCTLQSIDLKPCLALFWQKWKRKSKQAAVFLVKIKVPICGLFQLPSYILMFYSYYNKGGLYHILPDS